MINDRHINFKLLRDRIMRSEPSAVADGLTSNDQPPATAGGSDKTYWRHLDELADSPVFEEFVRREQMRSNKNAANTSKLPSFPNTILESMSETPVLSRIREPGLIDVIIVGGGPAGLSAALILGRCLRRVLVCDAGEPRNAASHSMHGYLSRDGISPQEFLRSADSRVQAYVQAFRANDPFAREAGV